MTTIKSAPLTRRIFLAAAGSAAIPPLLLGGCGAGRPRAIILLDDLSASRSTGDLDSQRITITNCVGSMRAAQEARQADQLILAPIGDAPLSAFSTLLEETITSDGMADSEEQIDTQRKKLVETITSIAPLTGSRWTRCFDALTGAAEVMASAVEAGRTPSLIIMSDMLEDSLLARFAASAPTEADTRCLLVELRRQGLLPNFEGARVRVTGGGGKDGEGYEMVKNFWKTYFKKENANGNLVTYTRAPLTFAPGAE